VQGLDVKKLTDYTKPTYRLRIGDYRIIFEIYNDQVQVLVIGVTHRKDAY
jgi:mRNA interferase RelE/StbE